MYRRIAHFALVLLLSATVGFAADLEAASELYRSGDLEAAQRELTAVLEAGPASEVAAPALELLGQIAIDRDDWDAALEAWSELVDKHALSREAAAVSAAIRPLQALTARLPKPSSQVVQTPAPQPVPPPASRPPLPANGTGFIVGGFGTEYDASQEVTERLIDFLVANDVEVHETSTEIPAIRGEEVVLSYLIDEARTAGAEGVLFISTRFGFREFVEIHRYDLNGVRIWKDRTVGGTALKERHDRGRVSWGLVDRAMNKLSKRLGSPDLPKS